jgi:hypothetical protein
MVSGNRVLRIHGFVLIQFVSFQKIRFADLICNAVFKRFVLRIRFATRFSKDSTNLANPHESLVNRRTLDKQILNFWIRKSVCSSKDSFCGFVLRCGSQKIRFTDLICKKKIPKLLNSFRFGRIRIRFRHPFNLSNKISNL